MTKRAAIYIRTSSERQAEKASPQAQEADCRAYCEERGYQVVEVYRDIKRYKAGGKLVEPSGTRADRPGFKAIIGCAKDKKIDVIIAWRLDRLCRGYRPFVEIDDLTRDGGIEIELVKERFDPLLAGILVSIARAELDARHDRIMMGIAKRLSTGKSLNNQPVYGYYKDSDGYFHVNEDEAQWVRKLFEWYADEVSIREIRERFISGGAKQRKNTKYTWNKAILRRLLRYKVYWTGKSIVNWDGKKYEIPAPPIVSEEIANRVQARKATYKHYPAGNARNECLCGGLVYCAACGTRACVESTLGPVLKDGTRKRYTYYLCSNRPNADVDGCFKRISTQKIDGMVWDQTWGYLVDLVKFEAALQMRIEELQAEEEDAEAACKRLQHQLDEIAIERQKVIGWARKEIITEDDLDTQLLGLSWQEGDLQRQLSDKSLLLGNRAERLIDLSKAMREKFINAWNAIDEKEHQKFRRSIVQNAVTEVKIYPERRVRVAHVLGVELGAEIDLPIMAHPPLG